MDQAISEWKSWFLMVIIFGDQNPDMTKILDRISRVVSNYDAIVLDQYGVLHDGSSPYAET